MSLFVRRLAITLVIPLAIALLRERLLLPGISAADVEALRAPPELLGVFALGIMPFLSAYWIVEVFAFFFLRRLRHGNPEGRAKLERAARVLGLLLAAMQAWACGLSLKSLAESVDAAPSISVPLVTATLVGGVCVQFVAASLITHYGLLNGFVALVGVSTISALVDAIGLRAPAFEARDIVLAAIGLALAAVATWCVLHGAGRIPRVAATEGDAGAPYRDARRLALRPWIPLPASSFQPYLAASSLLMLPATLVNLHVPLEKVVALLNRDDLYLLAWTGLTGVLMLVFARLMHRPSEMADLAARLGATKSREVEAESRATLWASLGVSFLFFVTVILAASVSVVAASSVALLVAVAMDLTHSLRAAWAEPDRVVVWEERRASAVPMLRAALAADGIDSDARGMAVQSFYQVFAPYAPAQIVVRSADAERAAMTLRHLLMNEAPPARDEGARAPLDLARDVWSLARRGTFLGVTVAVAAALLIAHRLPSHSAGAAVARAELEVLRVDDEVDAFERIDDESIPEGLGVSVYQESVPVGRGVTQLTHFARIALGEHDTASAALSRARPWLVTIPLPEGRRLGFEDVTEVDDETHASSVIAVRTFVLTGEPIIRTVDVVEAVAQRGEGELQPYVAITLSPDGAKRFEAATRQWRGRRIAIIVDGKIAVAPVVKSAITGGTLSITLGPGDPKSALAEGKALAERLRP